MPRLLPRSAYSSSAAGGSTSAASPSASSAASPSWMSSASRSIPSPSPISSSAASSSASASGRANVDAAAARTARSSMPPVLLQTGRGRDQLADDHVLLQAEQPVDLALDRRVGQHLRRLLEGGGREERLGRERGLRDPEDQRLERRLLASSPSCTRAFSRSSTTLSTSWPGRSVGVAGALDAHLLQHLPDDQLDVLVVDVDALRLVDLLHLADEVQLGRRRALRARAARPG